MKKKIFIFLFTFFFIFQIIPIYSQTDELPVNKYKDGHVLDDFISMPRKALKGVSISLGYQKSQFLNSQFGTLTEKGLLKQNYGWTLNFCKIIYPIIIDANVFLTSYNNKTSANNYPTFYQGFDGSISTALLPLIYKFSKTWIPYFGVGYTFSELFEIDKEDYILIFTNRKKIFSIVNLTQPIWKTGIMINVSSKFLLDFDYKQSIKLNNNEKALNQFSISMGYRLGKNNN